MGVNAERIGIIGAGISGLVMAIALRKQGYSPVIFEKSEELKELNAPIILWPNASRVLKNLGLFDKALSKGTIINEWKIQDDAGDELKTASLELYDQKAICLNRADLFDILLNSIPTDSIVLRKIFQRYQNTNNQVTVHFEDESSENFDLLLASDGLNSKVREQMINDGKAIFRGYMVWRGVLDFTHKDVPENASIEIWGKGKRFGFLPMGNGRLGWWAAYNETPKNHQHMVGRKKKLVNMFRSFNSPASQIINATPEEDIFKSPVFDREPLLKWHEGKVLLIGDAAHPVTPNRWQGACLAIEDAASLASLMKSSPNLESAIHSFEANRIPRTTIIQKETLRHGEVGQWENKWAIRFRNYYVRKMSVEKSRQILDYMYLYEAE